MIYTDKGATLSTDRKYRYSLWREWRGTHEPKNWFWLDKEHGEPKSCLFIMLNPSKADGTIDDPTIRRCVSFAKREKYERLEVVNLFAYRATKPEELLKLSHVHDPVGWENSEYVSRAVADAGLIICAWGAHGKHLDQDETMLGWITPRKTYCLGKTPLGYPRHPLYVKGNEPLVVFP